GHDFPPEGPQGTLRASLWRSPTAIALTVMFALQSTNAYTQFGLLPQILIDSGVTPARAGLMVGTISGWGIVGGLLMPTIIDRSRRLPWIVGGLGLLTASGYAGLLLAPGLSPLLWTSVLGIGGFAFPSVLALIPARSRDPLITARLSGLVQPVGYLLAAIGPIAAGAVLEAKGTSAMLVLMGTSGLLLAVAGYRAARPRMVTAALAVCLARKEATPPGEHGKMQNMTVVRARTSLWSQRPSLPARSLIDRSRVDRRRHHGVPVTWIDGARAAQATIVHLHGGAYLQIGRAHV